MTAGKTSSCWALIPVKPPGACKTRLAGVLSPRERDALVSAMLRHVVEVAKASPAIDRVLLAGPRWHDYGLHSFAPALDFLPDDGTDLNLALAGAMERIAMASEAPQRLIVLSADLPRLTGEDIAALAGVGRTRLAIAPDRHGTGTNALSLPLPEAAGLPFLYGTGSAAAHRQAAKKRGIKVAMIRRTGLAHDVDVPDDLAVTRHLSIPA